MIRVKSVKVLEGFKALLTFTDGAEKTIDLSPYLRGPIFEPLKNDPAKFRQVRVDPELATIVWPNGADVCPDALFHGRVPASPGKAAR